MSIRFLQTAFVLSSSIARTSVRAFSASRSGSTAMNFPSGAKGVEGIDYPALVVFDLDACLWDQEMFEMSSIPNGSKDTVVGDLNGRGEGVLGVYSGRDKISLHPGALLAFQEHGDNMYPGMKVALASSANTPFAEKIGRTTLKLLEVFPGVSVWDILMRDWDGRDVNQIGRQPPLLSPSKARSHFPNLRKMTEIRYDKMLFFDDCNWDDHCALVQQACREGDTGTGVTTYRTPRGLGVTEWKNGMKHYADTIHAQRKP